MTSPASSHSRVRILVADDHFVVRSGLVALIECEPELAVIAQASDGEQAVALFREHQPDLAVLDLRMPGLGGREAIEQIRREFPAARILVLTAYNGDEDIHGALAAGASGYLLKSSTGDDLIPAIRQVCGGGRWIPRDVASRLAVRERFEALTPRELDVLRETAKGLANKEIAATLGITENTVKDHLKHILGKLQVAGRTEAVTAAVQRGLLEL
ncbi:response regulator [Actomonas aquatica]|uniref:Response regulator transcription factor n=1 Tax=Actomonas aquatica TaxID=2866162 RepID=A0ABZ1C609_9BACT|nr:response regulator transcription factor [Opitutus sp. WL0086]WRQ87161.1 response regulator transcription factor [Opitutus sp. WL0086]